MALEQDIRRLARLPLFGALEADALRLIAFSGEKQMLATDEILFRKGDVADSAFFVLTGALALDVDDDRPTSRVIAGPDTLIGETAMLVATERPSTARALERSVVLKIPRRLMHRVLNEFPDDAIRLRATLARELANFAQGLDRVRAKAIDPR